MKSFLTTLFSLGLALLAAAQTLPPGTSYVPKTLLNYDYWRDQDKNIGIRDHFASTYLESNHQYQHYLRCLQDWEQDSLWQRAQPDPAVWDVKGLDEQEKAYLKAHYWTDKAFEHYPVVGLSFDQIRQYLFWKTNMLNLAAYEKAGGTGDYFFRIKPPKGWQERGEFPKPFSTSEYVYQTSDATRIFKPFAAFRLPTSAELFAELPLPKKTKRGHAKPDKKLAAWLSSQPKFAFLAYEPAKPNGVPTELREALEFLGIRPVVESDIAKLKKRSDEANLPQMCMQMQLPKELQQRGYIYACDEEELRKIESNPSLNPKNLPIVLFDYKKACNVAWVSDKGRLITLSIASYEERPLCGFRGMMTKTW